MSRGPGAVQNAVFDYLSGVSEPTTFETVRWETWERRREATSGPMQNLPNKWNTTVKRGLEGLEKAGRIGVIRRRLVSLEECAAHYPNKTLNGEARQLRLQLLPALLRWTREERFYLRYNLEANEKFYLDSLAEVVRDALKGSWLDLEPRLMESLAVGSSRCRNALFMLIARGKSIFETQDVKSRGSFAEHLRHCTDNRFLPEALAADVRALSDAMLPPTDADHLQFRSYIHTFADVPRHRGCRLKNRTVDYLDQACPDVVRALPGYRPPDPKAIRYRVLDAHKATHSPQLYGLFDQTVFQTFHFLTIL